MSELQWILSRDACFRYMLLGRMMSECKYYLGFGNTRRNSGLIQEKRSSG